MSKFKSSLRHIPNALTAFNLLAGCLAIVAAFEYQYGLSFLFIVIGSVFDFADGFVARLVKSSSEYGKILDSLSDVVTFGVAPSVILFSWMKQLYWLENFSPTMQLLLPYTAFAIAMFSGLRLAKFHVDTRQSYSFIGLPTPGNALLISSIAYFIYDNGVISITNGVSVLLGISILCFLLVSEIPMFALKFKSYNWKENKTKYIFLAGSIVCISLLNVHALPAIIVFYILLSIVNGLFCKK